MTCQKRKWLRNPLKLIWHRLQREEEHQLEDLQTDLKREISRNLAWRTALLNEQIGLIVTSWSAMEMAIELAIHLVHRHGGNDVHPVLPTTFNARLWYLRHVPEKIEDIRHLRKSAIQLCERIDRMKNDVGDLISGKVYIDDQKFNVNIENHQYKNDEFRSICRQFTFEDFADMTRSCVGLLSMATKFGSEISLSLGEVKLGDTLYGLGLNGATRYEAHQRDRAFARSQVLRPKRDQ